MSSAPWATRYLALRGADLEISQSCIYCITQNRASTIILRTRMSRRCGILLPIAPSIVVVDLQAHRCIICILYAWSAWYRLVDIRERIIGSGATFRSRDHPDIYLDMYLAASSSSISVITTARAHVIPRYDLIFVKKRTGCLRMNDIHSPFRYRYKRPFSIGFIYSANYRDDLRAVPLRIIMKTK